MLRFLSAFLFYTFLVTGATAQWQIPNNTVPYGKGPGKVGFGSVTNPATGAQCLIDTSPPTFGPCPGATVVVKAVCNGVEGTGASTGTDDFTKFTAAAAALPANGGTILVPSIGTGKCLWKLQAGLNPSLKLTNNSTLLCVQPTVILVEGTPNGVNGYSDGAVTNSDQVGGNTNINVIGCSFKTAGPTSGSVFIALKNVNGGSIQNVRLLDNNASARAQIAYTSNFFINNYFADYTNGPWTKVLQTIQSVVISSITNSAGLYRVTTSTDHGLVTGNRASVYGATGSVNGSYLVTKISATVVDLQGSTFATASGGRIGNLTGYEDGLRIGSGSHNVSVNGCVINSGDDAIALNNEPSETGGSTTGADIRDITVTGCELTTRNGNAIRVYQEATMIAGSTYRVSFNGITGAPTHYADNGLSLRDNSGRRAIHDIDYNSVKLNFAGVTGTSAIESINTDRVTFTGLTAAVVASFGLNASDARRTILVNSEITGALTDNVNFSAASTASAVWGGYYASAGRDNIHIESTDDAQVGGARLEAPIRSNIRMVTALRSIIYNNRHISASASPTIQEETGSNNSTVYAQNVDGVTTGIDTSTAGAASCYFIFPCVSKTKLDPTYGGIGAAVGMGATIAVRKGDDTGSCNLVVLNGVITSTTC